MLDETYYRVYKIAEIRKRLMGMQIIEQQHNNPEYFGEAKKNLERELEELKLEELKNEGEKK